MCQTEPSLKVHILNVGHGDNIIVEFPNGNFGVVDCYLAEKTLNYLDKLKAKELQFVCATHPHIDHTLGIPTLLREYRGRIRQFWHCGFPHLLHTDIEILELLEEDSHIIRTYQRTGSGQNQGDVRIVFLAPTQRLYNDFISYGIDINNASIVIKLTYHKSEIILGADALDRSWGEIARDFPTPGQLNCQVIKVPHHGSDNGIPFGLLRRIKPSHAIFTTSAKQARGGLFPNQAMLQLFRKIGSKLHNTADRKANGKPLGSVVVCLNGSNRPRIERLGDEINKHPNPHCLM